MPSLPFYCVHLLLLAAGLLCLRRAARTGRLERWRGARGWALALALGALTFAISEPQHRAFEDFLDAYYAAGAAVLAGETQASRLFARGVHGFVSHPVVALVFAPFALLPPGVATFLHTALGAAAACLAWRLLVRSAGLAPSRAALLALLFALDGPLSNSIREGNTSHFVLLALVLAFARLREGRDWSAGALLGAAALFKLPILLFGPYLALRGRWRGVAAGAGVLAAASLLSLAVFGGEAQRVWYERFVAGAVSAPIAAFNVQSIAAFFGRWERGGAALCDWNAAPLGSPALAGSLLVTFALYAAALGVLAARRGRLEQELSLVLALACVTSPVSWSHYYAWLLIPIAYSIAPPGPLSGSRGMRWLWAAAILCVILPVVLPECAPAGPLTGGYVVLLSLPLCGGLLLLLLLLRQQARGS